MNKFKIVNESDMWVAYEKRKMFGWKRLTPIGLPTIYAVTKFLSENYEAPLFYKESNNEIEILNSFK